MNGIWKPGKPCILTEIFYMRTMALLLIGLCLAGNCFAQKDSVTLNPKDVASADAIIASLYNVISGPAGEKRNWTRMRNLFIPEAKMMATGVRPDGSVARRVMNIEDYIASSGPLLEKDGFFETELGRKTEQFGNIIHVFSTYESRRKADDDKPFMRGINSIQLWYDGTRWWIVNILWQNESPKMPIPEKYLQ